MAHNDRRKVHKPCGREVAHTLDGRPYTHKCIKAEAGPEGFEDPTPRGTTKFPVSDPASTVEPMDDSFEEPTPVSEVGPVKGPWFGALYDGTCDGCFDPITEGDRIRADGQGGYECEDCGSFDDTMDRHVRVSLGIDPNPAADTTHPGLRVPSVYQEQASAAAKRHLAAQATDTPYVAVLKEELRADDLFEDPTPKQERPRKINVSGQPEANRDWQKRYIVVDPDLGDFRRTKTEKKPKGITRATTFNKHAQNTIALNGWSKRNVVMGASLRPDILRRAHGLTHDNGKDELNRIVDELETAAGAKVSADEGTFLHEFCDQVDAGLKTWKDAPAAYQQDIKRYVDELAKYGLEPVPGLIERTTFIREFGGVCGTFDRILFHRPSGRYIVGDLKTGKTMKYAMDETECQLWTYAHGVNQNGIYDWNTDTWGLAFGNGELVTVSERVGVIVHMPVQGPEAGEVYLRFANLERGAAYAELNHAVNSYEKSKVQPFDPSVLMPVTPQGPTWEERFAAVANGSEAADLWQEALGAGVDVIELRWLTQVAQQALADKG